MSDRYRWDEVPQEQDFQGGGASTPTFPAQPVQGGAPESVPLGQGGAGSLTERILREVAEKLKAEERERVSIKAQAETAAQLESEAKP